MGCNYSQREAEDVAQQNIKLSAQEIYKRTVNSSVTVIAEQGFGSGFFIDSNIIITNYHVIEGSPQVQISLNNSEVKYNVVGYVSIDKINDLVLLQTNYKCFDFIRIEEALPQPGDKIFAIGSPVGLSKTISEGIVSGIRNFDDRKLIQITAPISHGSSGCPIINEHGKAIGVAVGGISDANNVGFCIPSNYIKTLMDFKESYPKELIHLSSSETKSNSKTSTEQDTNSNIKVINERDKISSRYLGKHLLAVYAIGLYKQFGSVIIKCVNGHYYLTGSLRTKNASYYNDPGISPDSYFKIEGEIQIENESKFQFTGSIIAYVPRYESINSPYNDNDVLSHHEIIDGGRCEWHGSCNFEGLGAYWRARYNGCWYHTSDIDIFFNATGTN